MYQQGVSNLPTNIIKEKSKLIKPRAEKIWVAQIYQFNKHKHKVSLHWFINQTLKVINNRKETSSIRGGSRLKSDWGTRLLKLSGVWEHAPGLSRSKFGATGLLRGQITLRAQLINNKLEGGIVKKIKKFLIFL